MGYDSMYLLYVNFVSVKRSEVWGNGQLIINNNRFKTK